MLVEIHAHLTCCMSHAWIGRLAVACVRTGGGYDNVGYPGGSQIVAQELRCRCTPHDVAMADENHRSDYGRKRHLALDASETCQATTYVNATPVARQRSRGLCDGKRLLWYDCTYRPLDDLARPSGNDARVFLNRRRRIAPRPHRRSRSEAKIGKELSSRSG